MSGPSDYFRDEGYYGIFESMVGSTSISGESCCFKKRGGEG